MKKKLMIFTVFYFTLISCFSQTNLSFENLLDLKPTHSIKNELIIKPIKTTIKILNKKNSLFNIVIIQIDSINYNKENIYLHPSNFQMEQLKYKLEKNEKLEPDGYLFMDGYPILIYGDLSTFFKVENERVDILKYLTDTDLLIDLDPMYEHYLYHRDTILGNLNEGLIYKGESNNKID